jgi:hypothetical protein
MKRSALVLLAAVMLTLVGLSTIQASTAVDVSPLGPQETSFGPEDLCNNIFIQCGGLYVCPGNCHCEPFGTATGICIKN